jgi:radical SAM superfamily enzyme YgiQ (UPF0313 family)
MKVKLIYPRLVNSLATFDQNSLSAKFLRRMFHLGQTNYTPPLSLLMLGAVTPPDVEVQIIDERLDKIDFDEEVDLVGITVTTRAVSRAREIATEYRKRGVTVVVGGIHPSVMPEESSSYADVVVVGEGEGAWPQVLADYKQGNLKQIYKGEPQNDLDKLPFPRRELIRHPEKYATTKVITTSRGCPNSCTFCAAGFAVGKRHRVRSVENVLTELYKVPGKFFFFLDDNLGWNLEHSKKLFKALIPLNIKWVGGVSLSAFEDIEFADLVAESGCIILDIGFESIRPRTIAEMKKQRTNNPSQYRELIKRLHDRGIMIKGQFIIGFDEDDNDVFQELIDFINETCIEIPTVNTLIPYPGTSIFRQYEKEGRLLHKDWDYYDTGGAPVVYSPKQMTCRELVDGYFMVTNEIYSIKSIIHRLMGAKTLSSITISAIIYNLHNRRGKKFFTDP